ncbi:MAG TPA: response regulator transcription factor [Gemmatimonadota bacterium]|nr:response regulator transcription factor [Gemmatimonadota bacterium]
MDTPHALDRGRKAFGRQAWAEAFTALSRAEREGQLEPEDLERLARVAYLTGRDEASADAWSRAHQAYLHREEVARAAGCAFWLGFQLVGQGDRARGGGWIARARRLVDQADLDCVERGFLRLPEGLRFLAEGEPEAARAAFDEAAAIGVRFEDPDLVALGRLGRGQALVRLGDVEGGVSLLDEAMAAADAGDLSPIVVGIVYCAVVETCGEIFDVARAREWTAALSDWCDAHPELVPYRGQCLVRRSQILQLDGAWMDAAREARRACERLAGPPAEPAAGAAFYQRGELHRLRGEFEEAAEAYGEARTWGRRPQPGLALLNLARGREQAASEQIRRALEETRDRDARAALLPAFVEIELAAGDVGAAADAAAELSEIAGAFGAAALEAAAAAARGAVRLADEDPRAALGELRTSWRIWEQIGAPYEVARVRILMALVRRELGDEDAARSELEAAERTFDRLGAAPDVARVESLARRREPGVPFGLSPRELEVLRHVAAGKTNRAIGETLSISERTVERHVSNIFHKLHVSTRTAAAAWAYEHDLV